LPYLSHYYSIYIKTGLIESDDIGNLPEREKRDLFATPFYILSNYKSEPKYIESISPYFLATLLLDYIDAPIKGYWKFIYEYSKVVSVYNPRTKISIDGEIGKKYMSDEVFEFAQKHNLLTYDRIHGKRYSN